MGKVAAGSGNLLQYCAPQKCSKGNKRVKLFFKKGRNRNKKKMNVLFYCT